MEWKNENNYMEAIWNKTSTIYTPLRVASFDLDDTLIIKHMKKTDEWELIDPRLPKLISSLVAQQYIIVIFTNQGGMTLNKNFDLGAWTHKVNRLARDMMSCSENFYLAIYVAKNYDMYRKPNIGLWNVMISDLKTEFNYDKKFIISKKSFYCGDAAGRIESGYFNKLNHPKRKGDFSDVDIKFAQNIGIKFITPEQFYLGYPAENIKIKGFNPKEFVGSVSDKCIFEPRKKEVIIIVAPPGSGKTEFVKRYILPHNYVHLDLDVCRSRCSKIYLNALSKDESIVVDGTNPSKENREKYIEVAKNYNYRHIRCIEIDTDLELAKHLNNVRHVYSDGKIPKINDIVYNIYKKKYIPPDYSEGFDVIEKVPFRFDIRKLNDPEWKKIFLMWS